MMRRKQTDEVSAARTNTHTSERQKHLQYLKLDDHTFTRFALALTYSPPHFVFNTCRSEVEFLEKQVKEAQNNKSSILVSDIEAMGTSAQVNVTAKVLMQNYLSLIKTYLTYLVMPDEFRSPTKCLFRCRGEPSVHQLYSRPEQHKRSTNGYRA